MRKNYFFMLLALVTLSTFTACSSFESKKISKPEDMADFVEELKSTFPDKNVLDIRFMASENLKDDIGIVSVFYYTDGKVYQQTYTSFTKSWGDPSKSNLFQSKSKAELQKCLKSVADFDFSKTTDYFNQAVDLIKKNTDEFEGFKLYSIEEESLPDGKLKTSFTLNVRKVGESSTIQGRNRVINYYEFKFIVNEAGDIEYVD